MLDPRADQTLTSRVHFKETTLEVFPREVSNCKDIVAVWIGNDLIAIALYLLT